MRDSVRKSSDAMSTNGNGKFGAEEEEEELVGEEDDDDY